MRHNSRLSLSLFLFVSAISLALIVINIQKRQITRQDAATKEDDIVLPVGTAQFSSNEVLVKLRPNESAGVRSKTAGGPVAKTDIAELDIALSQVQARDIKPVFKTEQAQESAMGQIQAEGGDADTFDRWYVVTLSDENETLVSDDPEFTHKKVYEKDQKITTRARGNKQEEGKSESDRKKNGQIAHVKQAIHELKKLPAVEHVQPNYVYEKTDVIPNDYFFSSVSNELWDMKKINMSQAWTKTTGTQAMVVAVSDTGIDYTHPDLAANIWKNPGESGNGKETNGLDDDGNGKIDDYRGWDFTANDNDPMDDNGHGTHVAGIIGAVGNNDSDQSSDTGKRVVGVLHTVSLMPVKGMDRNGSGYIVNLANGIVYAANKGAKVINMSWGGISLGDALLTDSLRYAYGKGVILVAAAGNSSDNAMYHTPANSPYVITVASSNEFDKGSCFTNYGPKIDVSAPGGDSAGCGGSGRNILSTRSKFTSFPLTPCCYTAIAGTSMAAPHVAGIAALVKILNPLWNPEQVRQALHKGVDDIGSLGFDWNTGFGRVNAMKVLTQSEPLIVAITSPQASIITGATTEVPIKGTARGTNFAKWQLDFGLGEAPTSWTQIATAQTQTSSSDLGTWNIQNIADGIYTLRLSAFTTTNVQYEYRMAIVIDRFVITSPETIFYGSNFFTIGSIIEFRGTMNQGNLKNYRIEVRNEYRELIAGTNITLANGGTQRVVNGLLGTWDTSGMPQGGYFVELWATYTDGKVDLEQFEILLDTDYHTGWPRKLVDYIGPLAPNSLPVLDNITVSDINKDGKVDLLFGYVKQLSIYDHTGTNLPGWPQNIGGTDVINKGPAVGDINNDGSLEIVLATSSGRVFVWSGNGVLMSGWPKTISGAQWGSVTIDDINGDFINEIIITGYFGDINVINAQGVSLSGWPKRFDTTYELRQLTPPVVGDIDRDGKKEIVVANTFGPQNLYVVSAAGVTLPGWPKTINPNASNKVSVESNPALADLDKNNTLEIVVGTTDGKVLVFKKDGTTIPGWPQTTTNNKQVNSITIGDIDNDGSNDIVAGTANNDLYLWKSNGTVFPGWPIRTPVQRGNANDTGYLTAALADIDGDSIAEIISVSRFDGAKPFPIHAFKLNGIEVSGFPRPALNSIGFHGSTPAIADFDGDGYLELAVLSDVYLRMFMWDLKGAPTKNRAWPMFNQNARHTGRSFGDTMNFGGNSDKDTFVDKAEQFMGTDTLQSCATGVTHNAWPADTNNDTYVNGADVSKIIPFMYTQEGDLKYNKRYDMNTDRRINDDDVTLIRQFFLQSCPK